MEYSEEEKKAIGYLNDFKSIKIMYGNTFTMFLEQLKKYQQATDTILNLLEKQQKEIEEQKSRKKKLNTLILDLNKALEDSISKEAIRELYNKYFEDIKIYDRENKKRDSYYYECIKVCDVLKELLGE